MRLPYRKRVPSPAEAFAGKTAIVTGAASGIGRELAQQLVAAGANVALLDVDAGGIDTVAAGLPQSRRLAVPCDIRELPACEAAVATVREAFGGVDLLFNNAGMSHHSRFADTDLAVLRRVMEVNFWGSVHCTRAALADLIDRRGMIVVTSSIAGFAPLVERCGYAASKHALHGCFDTLRAELADTGVGVLVVCPSFVRTAIDANALAGDGGPVRGAKRTVGAPQEPGEIARAILDATARRRRRLLPSPVAGASYWLSALAPQLYDRLMSRSMSRDR